MFYILSLCLWGVKVRYNGKANLSLRIDTEHRVVTDSEGRKFELTVAFPYGPPTIGISEKIGQMGGNGIIHIIFLRL